MKRWHSILLTILALLLVVPLVLMLRPEGPLDLSKDEEPFRSMVLPPQTVYALAYFDGGSAGFVLVDKIGVKYEICFPIDNDGIINTHPTAYHGNLEDPKKIRLKKPARAKSIVIRLLKEYGKRYPEYRELEDIIIRNLSEPKADVPSRLWERTKRWYYWHTLSL